MPLERARGNSVNFSEAQTRALQIDPQLRAADWKLNDRTQVRLEVPVDGYDAEPWNGVTDYCLYDASGNVLAVVEAKRCSRNAREADEQLRYYVTEIAKKQGFAPFGFMANGHDIWFWEVGLANPRLVAGFFTPADLERLKFLRQNRQPLEATSINSSIFDRDTFRLFGCDSNVPTFLYDYPQAVKDGFLVDFSLYQAHTGFQRKGIKGVDLSEEDRNALVEQGIDPDSLDYEGTEIEVEVSNKDTLRKQWEELMDNCLRCRG